MSRKRCPPEQIISMLRQARARVAGTRGRGEGPADAEVGGEGQEVAGSPLEIAVGPIPGHPSTGVPCARVPLALLPQREISGILCRSRAGHGLINVQSSGPGRPLVA